MKTDQLLTYLVKGSHSDKPLDCPCFWYRKWELPVWSTSCTLYLQPKANCHFRRPGIKAVTTYLTVYVTWWKLDMSLLLFLLLLYWPAREKHWQNLAESFSWLQKQQTRYSSKIRCIYYCSEPVAILVRCHFRCNRRGGSSLHFFFFPWVYMRCCAEWENYLKKKSTGPEYFCNFTTLTRDDTQEGLHFKCSDYQ